MSDDLLAALRRRGVTDVDDSVLSRALYSSDASLYRVPPRVVVRPRHPEEIEATLEVAREARVPLTMRGAGTSIAGNAVGPGLVVDTSRHLDRVLSLDRESRTATVQPGTVHATLQRQAAAVGLRYGPDPSTHSRCTIGGMIGNNACGSRALGYGRTADNVAGLRVLTADGRSRWLTDGTAEPGSDPEAPEDRLAALVAGHLGEIRTGFGRFGRQVSGYSLEHLLPEHGRRLDRFLVGSEGTLGVVLEATVELVPEPPARALAVLGFPTMADAADATPGLLDGSGGAGLVACEGLGSRIVDVVRERRGGVPELPPGGGWLFAEVTGDSPAEAEAAARAVAAAAGVPHRVVSDPREAAGLWRIREDGAGLAARSLDRPAHAGWEDAAVPPERLGAYLRGFEALLREHRLDGVPYGHFGSGCVHVRIDFQLEHGFGRAGFRSFVEQAADLVASHGGSLSGEHGDGRARSELLARMYGADAVALMRQVKGIFDPDRLLNSGVLVDPAPLDADLRLASAGSPRTTLRLVHDGGSFSRAVHRCTGVGRCLADNTGGGGVMCPSYVATRDEKDSTRGRARVLQEVANGSLVRGWRDDAVAEALDLCLSCKGCSTDCPTGVDMATYKAEALHQRYRFRLRPRSHYALGQLPRWARLARPVAPLLNRLLDRPSLATVARRSAGVDQRRSLPRFARRSLRATAPDGRDATPDVWLWADTFTDYFAPDAGHAAVELLAAAGLRAAVIPATACCGLTWVSTGQLDGARRVLGRAVRALHPYVASGVPVVGLEPSCLATLRGDAVELLDDPRAAEVAGGVRTLAELLGTLDGWRPPDLTGRTLVVQPHCHHTSVLGWDADEALLARTGASVVRVGGCCGLAGNFGVEQGHYEVSTAVAEHALLPAVRRAVQEDGADAVVVADGFSCRTQLHDLADVEAVSLARLLTTTSPTTSPVG